MKRLSFSSVISIIACVVSITAAIVSFTGLQRTKNNITASLPPICTELRQIMPQTVQGVQDKFGVPASRVKLSWHYQCQTGFSDVYWGFELLDGDPVTVSVPEGGEIIDYQIDGNFVRTNSYNEGQVTGRHMFVMAVRPTYN